MASPSTNSQQSTQRAPQGPLRIVVVEDNRDDVLILTALLRAEGHYTKACYKGSEALDCIAKGADKILSEMNGFDYYLLKPADPKVLFALLAQARHPR